MIFIKYSLPIFLHDYTNHIGQRLLLGLMIVNVTGNKVIIMNQVLKNADFLFTFK